MPALTPTSSAEARDLGLRCLCELGEGWIWAQPTDVAAVWAASKEVYSWMTEAQELAVLTRAGGIWVISNDYHPDRFEYSFRP